MPTLVRVFAIAASAGMAWILASHGLKGLQEAAAAMLEAPRSGYRRLALGALASTFLGAALFSALRGHDS